MFNRSTIPHYIWRLYSGRSRGSRFNRRLKGLVESLLEQSKGADFESVIDSWPSCALHKAPKKAN